MSFHFGVTSERPFAEVMESTRAALADQGFGIITEIDMAATLQTKLGVTTAPYVILGACNPALAHEATSAVPEVGVLLPCNVVVREIDDAVRVDFMDPAAVMSMIDDPTVGSVAEKVKQRLEAVRDSLV